MAAPKDWLQQYYGPDFDLLNPAVVQEGQDWAIVRLQKQGRAPAGFSNIGYVLIRKLGRHTLTPHISLHEGVADETALKKMQQTLAEQDGT